jgi:hypothetical protein
MNKEIVVLLVALAISGCSSVVVEDGTPAQYSWAQRSLEATLDQPIAKVDQATRKALRDLKLGGIAGVVDELQGDISAQLASGKKVRIKLKAVGSDQTRVRIKIGTVGDKTSAEQIMRRIQKELSPD